MVEIKFTGTLEEIRHDMNAFLSDEAAEVADAITKKTKAAVQRKAKDKAPEGDMPLTTSAPPPPAAAPAPTSFPVAEVPTDAEAQAALVAVNDKFGIDKAVECLTKFGVKRGRELKPEQKAPFIAHCKSVIA